MKRLTARLLTLASIACCSIAYAEPPAMPDIANEDVPKAKVEDMIPFMTPLEGTNPAQWRVIWVGDAAREAMVSWTTKEGGTRHRVLYGADPGKLDLIQESQTNGQFGGDYHKAKKHGAFYHHAKLTGLQPDTDYHFIMESDGVRSKTLYFRTAPASGTGFSIIQGGDSRSGHADRCRMNLLIAAYARDYKEIIALAHGGDYIETGSNWDQWRLWLSMHELTTARDGRVLPLIPTRGNHDGGGPLYGQIFVPEHGGNSKYVTRLGNDVSLVTLNTNAPASSQADWIEEQLKELRPNTRWLMCQYHRPLYPAVKEPTGHAPVFCPLFDKYNVDICLESDGHCMKRTVPIRDGKKDPTGVTYVGEGGLGVKQKSPGARWYLDDGGKKGKGHHFMLLDFTDETLRCRFIMMDGSTWDDHSLKAR